MKLLQKIRHHVFETQRTEKITISHWIHTMWVFSVWLCMRCRKQTPYFQESNLGLTKQSPPNFSATLPSVKNIAPSRCKCCDGKSISLRRGVTLPACNDMEHRRSQGVQWVQVHPARTRTDKFWGLIQRLVVSAPPTSGEWEVKFLRIFYWTGEGASG